MHQRTNKPQLCLSIAASIFLMAAIWPADCMGRSDFQKAQQLIEQGKIPEARRALQSELKINPRNIEARYDLAVLLEESGHHADAQSLYEKNLRFSWHLPSLINLAAMLERQGHVEKAYQWLEKATKKFRHEAAPWYLLAAISEKTGHISKATTQHKKSIKADPLNGFAWLHFAAFQSRHKLADKGIKYAKKAMRLLSDCAPCWRSYGDIMQQTGHNNEALAAYQRSLAIRPDNQTRQQLIITLRHLGQTERAERMQQALDAWHKYENQQ